MLPSRNAIAAGVLTLALGLLVLGQGIVSPRYEVPFTDFGRDIAGAQAAIHGVNPYQRLGDLEAAVPDLNIPEDAEDFWVGHSPLSIAVARVVFHAFGEAAEDAGRVATGVSAVALITWILFGVGTHQVAATRMALAGAVAMSLGLESDLRWVQGACLLALSIAAWVFLLRRERRLAAVVLLGLIVAWRPWCAPLALFLPNGKAWSDAAGTALVATATTMVSAFFVGGLGVLPIWLTEALPQNTNSYLHYAWNVSLTGPYLGFPLALLVFGLVVAIGVFITRRSRGDDGRRWGSVAILGLFPMVWVHYWTSLNPVVVGHEESGSRAVVLAYLCMAVPLVGESPVATKVGAALALLLVGAAIRLSMKQGEPGPRTLGPRAGSDLMLSKDA